MIHEKIKMHVIVMDFWTIFSIEVQSLFHLVDPFDKNILSFSQIKEVFPCFFHSIRLIRRFAWCLIKVVLGMLSRDNDDEPNRDC